MVARDDCLAVSCGCVTADAARLTLGRAVLRAFDLRIVSDHRLSHVSRTKRRDYGFFADPKGEQARRGQAGLLIRGAPIDHAAARLHWSDAELDAAFASHSPI